MHVIIIGSGIAGITVAEEIKKLDQARSVIVLTRETHGYYSRPMLSHGFSREDVESKIVLRSFDALRSNGIEVRDGVDVLAIEREQRVVRLRGRDIEESLDYAQVIIATGSDAFIPPPFLPQRSLFHVLNSLDDLVTLRRMRTEVRMAGHQPHWAVVGGGLIGCELASDLAKSGDRVTLYHALPRLMERQLEPEDSALLATVLAAEGISLQLDAAVHGFVQTGSTYAVRLQNREDSGFDGIVAACGFKPRVQLAKDAGLPVARGILVDGRLTTADTSVFAIGDVAECPDGRLYAYILPIRSQALWLAKFLCGQAPQAWEPPVFKPKAKVHGFAAVHPYLF